MLTKLKWLKTYFTRDILPAAGATIGKILYTTKNTTGRRTQYVIDLDANNMDVTTINASPADPLTLPGQVVLRNDILAPQTDKNLYILGKSMPKIAKIVQAAFTQSIANAGTITAINVLTGVTITDPAGTAAAATTTTATITSVSATGLTLNTGTGAVTLDSNTVAGTYTLSYKVAVKYEPTVFVTGTISVTVAA